jgi:hypothetical protein
MGAPSGNTYPVGFRHARVYALDSNGVPAATATTPYEGLEIAAPKAYEFTIPDARRIAHTGGDRVNAQDVLPRLEVSSATLRAGRNDHDVYAVLTNTKKATIGESVFIGYGTDQQGAEPTVALLCYQQAKEVGTGVRTYRAFHVPSTQAIINPASMNENAPEFVFSLLPSAVDHYIDGTAFAVATEGYAEAEVQESITFGRPHICAWKGDNTVTEFDFPADKPATAVGKVHRVTSIATDGTVTNITATATITTTKITPLTKPAAGEIIVAWYEY